MDQPQQQHKDDRMESKPIGEKAERSRMENDIVEDVMEKSRSIYYK